MTMKLRFKWHTTAILLIAMAALSFYALDIVEKQSNPLGWDLELQQDVGLVPR